MPNWLRLVLVAFAAMLGVFGAVVAQIALLAELAGFGGEEPEPVAVGWLAVGVAASLGLPALLGWWLFPERGKRVFIVVLACGLLAATAVHGLLLLI